MFYNGTLQIVFLLSKIMGLDFLDKIRKSYLPLWKPKIVKINVIHEKAEKMEISLWAKHIRIMHRKLIFVPAEFLRDNNFLT